MKITTKQFGEVEYGDEHVIQFPKGLLGFDNLKKYLFIKTDTNVFYWLTSIENPDLAFPLVELKLIDENYPVVKNHAPFGVSILNSDPAKITVNLKAPVYIDHDKKSGFQKIIDNDKYPVNFKLFVTEPGD